MVVERPHTLGSEEAKRKLDALVDGLLARPVPGGVAVEDIRKTWTGNRMDVSARVKKGFMATTVAGTLEVTEDRVIVEAALPPIATSFIGEERIRQGISDQIDAALGRP